MLKITTTHVMKYPSGKWGFVGRVPASLCYEQIATNTDIMGGRAYKRTNGDIVTNKVRSFDTESEAREFAASVNATLAN